MALKYVLFEHAAGYGLFKVKEFEEIGALLPQVEESVTDISRFNQIVSLVTFSPFKTAMTALSNINSISEGVLPEDLQAFLEFQFPKASKRPKVTLGVSDAKLGAAITEATNITCSFSGAVPEILRGIRLHFPKLVQGFTDQASGIAQLGLGHSYSRAKVKFNVNRVDNMIIQSIALLDQLDKDINTFAMRIREWYSYHFPELIKIVPDNYLYARVVKYIKNRKELTEEKLPELEEIIMDSGKAQAILEAARHSMGMDISPVDLINIETFASRVTALSDYRKNLHTYLNNKMSNIAPNLSTLIGEQVGARLISHAGSLTNLAKYPASTVQILGAEKALFRALKTKSNTPKYGLLFHSSFIGRAGTANKGRISRFLANKCSIASRLDSFSDFPTSIFGEKLKQQVEDRLKFYETGEKPPKNVDVMKEAVEEFKTFQTNQESETPKKKKKKDKKRKSEQAVVEAEEMNGNNEEEAAEPPSKKKKKKKGEMNGNADESATFMQEEEEMNNGKTNLVLLGDSLFERMQDQEWFSSKFENYTITNMAVSGSRIAEANFRLDSQFCNDPNILSDSIIIVLLGTNDFVRNNEFNRSGYNCLVNAAMNICSKVLLVKVPPIPRLPEMNAFVHEANEWIATFEEQENVFVVDPLKYNDPKAPIDLSLFEPTYYNGKTDLIHLNEKGLGVLADSILQQLGQTESAKKKKKKNKNRESDAAELGNEENDAAEAETPKKKKKKKKSVGVEDDVLVAKSYIENLANSDKNKQTSLSERDKLMKHLELVQSTINQKKKKM